MTNLSVILISGGDHSNVHTTVELLHTNGSRICSLPDLPYLLYKSFYSQTGVTVCGGDAAANSTCHTLSSTGSWELSHNLAQARAGHSAWDSPQGIVLIGGTESRTTTEILLENGDTAPGFNLDYDTL